MLKPLTLVTMCMLLLVACGGATTPTATQPAATTTGTESNATAATTEQDIYASLPQSTTADGYYVLGKPDAPVVMTMYSDLL